MPNLVAATVKQGLHTHVVGRRLLYFPELTSTMDRAAELADQGAEEGTVVVAEKQSAGRGRHGRSWVSQPGNLLFSVLFRPELDQLPFISIIGGVAAARAVRKTTGLDPRIKWPNDLMLRGRKAAGILAESAIAGEAVWYAVLGIGINVALDTQAYAEEIGPPAVSINAAAGKEVPRERLLRQLLLELDSLYLQARRGVSPVPEWRDLIENLGSRVTVTSAAGSVSGTAADIDELGNLVLLRDDGQRITMTAGDVTLRPA